MRRTENVSFYQNNLLFLKFLCCYVEVRSIGGSCGIQDIDIVLQQRSVLPRKKHSLLLHPPTMADFPAFCMEERLCHHDRCSMHFRFRTQSAVQNIAQYILDFLLLSSMLHMFFCKSRYAMFTSSSTCIRLFLPISSNCLTVQQIVSLSVVQHEQKIIDDGVSPHNPKTTRKIISSIKIHFLNRVEVEVLIAVVIFWNIKPCSSLEDNRRFGGTYYPQLQGKRSRRYVPRLTLNRLHGVISQKIKLFTF